MSLLKDKDRQALEKLFSEQLKDEVTLHFFTQQESKLILPERLSVPPCPYCRETGQLVSELAATSPKLKMETHDFVADTAAVDKYGISRVPGIVVEGAKDYGVRFYGIPAGYEFASLTQAVVTVSRGEADLSEETRTALASLSQPVHLEVLVTPG